MKQRIKINGLVIIIGLAAIVFFPQRLIRQPSFLFNDFLAVIGLSFILLGQLLRVAARGHKAENSRGGNYLIQDGPYSMVRNPMYLGIILIGLGTVLFVLELWVAVLFALLFILRYWQLFVKEEKILQNNFGPQYIAYKKNVPRLFPSLAFTVKKEIRSCLSLKPAWFKRESLSIILVLGVCLLIKFRETLKFNGVNALVSQAFILLIVAVIYFVFILFLIKRDEK